MNEFTSFHKLIEDKKLDDKYIIKEYIGKNKKVNAYKCHKKWLNKHPEIKKYLKNRYSYFNGNYSDVVKLIRDGYKEWPKCKTCGKFIKVLINWNDNKTSYTKYCCNKCSNVSKEVKEKRKSTCLKRFGVNYPTQSEEVKRKTKKTNLQKYGVEHVLQNRKIMNKKEKTCLKRFGVKHASQCEKIKSKVKSTTKKHYGVEWALSSKKVREKGKKTSLLKYGVENPSQSYEIKEKCKQTMIEKYGVNNPYKCKKFVNKMIDSKFKNNTFNKSSQEDEIYIKLCKQFKKRNILRNYREDERYPFAVDFYIKSKDLFIECNFFWTHNNHWFNKNSKEDLKKIKEWKNKNNNFFNNAINTWSKKDVEKRDVANKNRINYIVFWNKKDYDKWENKNYPLKFQN